MDPKKLTDVIYEVDRGLAWITLNRPERYNAFRGHTIDELIRCFKAAWSDRALHVKSRTYRQATFAALQRQAPTPSYRWH